MNWSRYLDEIDSSILGLEVYSLPETALENFADLKKKIRESSSIIVLTKVEVGNIRMIRRLEEFGFRFSEVQIKAKRRISKSLQPPDFPYVYERISSTTELHKIIELATTTITHDRWTTDPEKSKKQSALRYRTYLEKSLSETLEEVWVLRSRVTSEIVAFRSHMLTGPTEATLLLGGVRHDLKGLGLGPVSWAYCEHQLAQSGIKNVTTHFSSANLAIINLELGSLGFRAVESRAVMELIK